MPTSIDLELAYAEVALFSKASETQSVLASNRMSRLIAIGLTAFEEISATEEEFRSMVTENPGEYEWTINARIFALFVNWLDISEQVISKVETLLATGLTVKRSEEFEQTVKETRRLFDLPVSFSKQKIDDLMAKSREWFLSSQLDSPGDQDQIKTVIRVLRSANLEARGITGDEWKEYSEIESYPGTLIGELRERLAIVDAPEMESKIDWVALRKSN